jgi:UDP-N-acetylmuramate--alanine ligase
MNWREVEHIYLLGIGGIGMSSLARYFNANGKQVSGYDKTATQLTRNLEKEGIAVHYEDLGEQVLSELINSKTLVVLTPAIPIDFGEWIALRNADFKIFKRAEVLGWITEHTFGIGVAGTHGKTTTSTMLAHVLHQTIGCNAFLGGISTNYNSNLILSNHSQISVVEADEFDRSFLQLKPKAGVLTSIDADHLDIYGDATHIISGFQAYIDLIDSEGFLLMHYSIPLDTKCETIRYGLDKSADITAENLRMEKGFFCMDVKAFDWSWKCVKLGVPGVHNAENALAVIGVALKLGLEEEEIRKGLETFAGVKRRFEYIVRSVDFIYIDDYAHHPSEIKALLNSIQLMYPGRKVTGVFQPHLFTRTRDFMADFAQELAPLDDLILMPIYPARELPIPGISSDVLKEKVQNDSASVMTHDEVLTFFQEEKNKPDILLTIGAGDIDLLVEPLKQMLL